MPASSEQAVPRRVLMLHGAGGGGWEWGRWRALWEAHDWQVETPDLAPSAEGAEATELADYLAQLDAEVAALAPQVLVGASLGGLLCLQHLAVHPGPALVLVNPLPPAPQASALPARGPYPPRVGWSSTGRIAGTVGAMEDASASARLFAYRRWRDESGQVLNAARGGITLPAEPAGPCLVIASEQDDEVPMACSAALALRLGASLLRLPGGHLSPLLGDRAHEAAEHAVAWLNTLDRFRSN